MTKTKYFISEAGIEPVGNCEWEVDDDGIYHTSCDHAWEFITGNLEENKIEYCPYCGSQIVVRAGEAKNDSLDE